ncbi:MAG: restriction endonuclease [Thaumarchaeota archaeon]|nr:restriction endonuclease [Nitrososphaerota archaeon]MBI3641117.1 restriction endonuclease [Nitrososphaerota archaeon]
MQILVKGIRGIIPGGVSVKDFSVVTDTNEETARQILDNFMQNGIGTFQDDQIHFQDNDKLKTSLLALRMGAPIDEISQILDWNDFEALVSEILELREFDVIRNLTLTKPRMQIDVIGTKAGVSILIDCKHWKRLSYSALETAVQKQIERTKHYVTKEKVRAALPAIVTLYQEEVKFINKIPIIPIFQLDSFCDEFYGNLEEMDLEQSE